MAVGTSGYIDVVVQPSSVGKVRVHWREDYDSLQNYSTITVTSIEGYLSHRIGWTNIKLAVSVDGAVIYDCTDTTRWHFYGNADGTFRPVYAYTDWNYSVPFTPVTSAPIYHNEDGTKTITLTVRLQDCWITGGFDGTNNQTASSVIALTAVPRASDLSVTNGRLGVAQTLLVDRKASGYTHTITYQCGGASGTICTQSSSTNVTWTPPIELARENTRGKTVDVAFTVTTYSGSTVIGTKTASSTLTIPPSVCLRYEDGWATASPYNEGTAAEGMNAYVQGYSKAQVTFDDSKISLADAYGATVAAYKITCNGKAFAAPYRSDVLSMAGNQTVTATVIDSRGYEVSQELSVFVEQYAKPVLSDIVIFRCKRNGERDDEGSYVSVTATGHISSIAGLNRGVLHIAIGQVASAEIPNGVTSVVGEGAVLHTSTYPVTLTVTDALGNRDVYTQLLATADVMFHGRKGGKGAAFGKYGEADDLLDVNWNLQVHKNLQIDGELRIGERTIGEIVLDACDPLRFMPIGYIYISGSPVSPASLFGGTWEQLSGRMLIGVGSATDMNGATWGFGLNDAYGSYEHGLKEHEMPTHDHYIYVETGWSDTVTLGSWIPYIRNVDGTHVTDTGSSGKTGRFYQWSLARHKGGSAPHYNMPPYLAKYMWERVE